MATGRFELALNPRWSGSFSAAAHRWHDGDLAMRDGLLQGTWQVVDTPTRMVRVHPGLTLPLGAVSSGVAFSPTTTGSFDPWLSADALVGGTWLGGASATVRAPFAAGSDGRRQGLRLRVDVRGARRTSRGVGWVGLSNLVQGPGEVFASTSYGLEAIAGWVFEPTETWSVTALLRVPLLDRTTFGQDYRGAGGLALARVNRPREKEEVHGPGDGHDH